MNNILSSFYARLRKEKFIILLLVAVAVLSLASMGIGGISMQMRYPDESENAIEYYMFETIPYISIFSGVLISLFLGREYSDGTIRNKILTGKTRVDYYLASFRFSLAMSGWIALLSFAGFAIGLPYFGLWKIPTKEILIYIGLIFLSTAAFAAIATFIAVLCANRTASVLIALGTSFVFLLVGSVIYNRLCQPPTTASNVQITADGQVRFGEEQANPFYVGGTLRTILTVIVNILPTGQQILAVNLNEEGLLNPLLGAVGSVGIIVVFTLIGIAVFRKKDLK